MSTESDAPALPAGVPTGLWIDGKSRGAAGAEFTVVNPANGAVLASVANATLADAALAMDSAQAAAGEWAATPPRQRSEILRRAFELLTERADDFARIGRRVGHDVDDAFGEACFCKGFDDDFMAINDFNIGVCTHRNSDI